MSQGSGGKWFDRDSRVLQGPGLAKPVRDHRRIVGSTIRVEESALCFQNLFGTGPAKSRQIGSYDAAFGRMAGLKGLHHRAEVFAQSGCLARRDREGASDVNRIQPFEPGAGGCAAKDTASAGRVKTVFIVAG